MTAPALRIGSVIGDGRRPASALRAGLLAALAALALLLAGCEGEAQVTVETATGAHVFAVEIADTPEARATGLMHREHLADDAGMIFFYDRPQVVTMWMKNTLIPLDMLFIRADGTVARIARNARPLSLETISAGEPVTAVLEIAGGRAREIGAEPGDRVILPSRE
ncbi:DUF192 domain-containing protein [Futiania mangrovi]|uniref:DUF192 domain-containing protein n=1 Tax=Futiania mangrovi TaxID=2959716 RepID=A0A9J6P8J1_9PROT|nr:DUF192 domain-containing protein [Futiania mangrovii]MCP1336028.1 DUF192 domain-containing protein [Futiania mangrovii]